jgi:hypothetical protein
VLGRKNRILDGWCVRVGRDPWEIERSAQLLGPQLDKLDAYLAAGITDFISDTSGPDDDLAPLHKLVSGGGGQRRQQADRCRVDTRERVN